ncbi:3'-5' exonuclease, partial [Escherichia coli]|uniref:3'-5' exonuclease n=1 Tax=Escherichia coli TaxID=562 RepID=UPI0028DF82AA
GANYRNILGFPTRYPGARTLKIEVNYRSVPSILNLANEAIKANIHQFAKVLTAVRDGGVKPWLIPCPDSNQQSLFVAQRIMELQEEGVALNEI